MPDPAEGFWYCRYEGVGWEVPDGGSPDCILSLPEHQGLHDDAGCGWSVLPTCAMCGKPAKDSLIVVTVIESDSATEAGTLCSTGCLIDYAAAVAAEEMESA